MAESLGGEGNCIPNGSSESRTLVLVNWFPSRQNINELPSELLSPILAYLPQKELVINRGVCRRWRDVIDEHCPMHFVRINNDAFMKRKMELRIKRCEIHSSNYLYNFWLTYPQCIRSLKLSGDINSETINRLVNEVSPYVEELKLNTREENIFPLLHVFPKLREINIWGIYDAPLNLTMDVPFQFLHQLPLLNTLSLYFSCINTCQIDKTFENFFNFLGKHGQTIKNLEVCIPAPTEMVEQQKTINLSNALKRLLRNGKLQFQTLYTRLEHRYISLWTPIIQSQKNLVVLNLSLGASHPGGGVAVSNIVQGIVSSNFTLQLICLEDIPSVRSDEDSWIPFDCSILRNAVNLIRLVLKGYDDDENMRPDIINLGHIPTGSLEHLKITNFVCNSGELQTLVDNAGILVLLELTRAIAPLNSPTFASTGVHGGIIKSFMDKPNKYYIRLLSSMNYSNEAENEKLNALELLYPGSHGGDEGKKFFAYPI